MHHNDGVKFSTPAFLFANRNCFVEHERRVSKRELEKKWAGFDADTWQQQQQQQQEMVIIHREKEQEWQEERRHLQVKLGDG